MRPVDDAAPLIPFVLAIELDGVAGLDRSNTIGQIDVVRHQHRLSGRQLNDESLVPAPFVVVGKNLADAAASLDLNVTPAILECGRQGLLATARTGVSVLLPRNEPAFDAAEVDGRQHDGYEHQLSHGRSSQHCYAPASTAPSKQHVERRSPGLAAVLRQHRPFTHAVILGFPCNALHDRLAIPQMCLAFENQRAVLEVAPEHHDRTAIGDPGLLPLFAHGVIAQDAVANESIGLLVELADGAALGDGLDACARYGRPARGISLEGIPIADPEIQLMVFGGAAMGEVGVAAEGAATAGAMKAMPSAADAIRRRWSRSCSYMGLPLE